jgi:hypothetical protein
MVSVGTSVGEPTMVSLSSPAGSIIVSLTGAGVPNSTAKWLLSEKNTTPYIGAYSEYVSGNLVAMYSPNTIISGVLLPDRSIDTDNPATITWGSNPTGVTSAMSGVAGTGVVVLPSADTVPALLPESPHIPDSTSDGAGLLGYTWIRWIVDDMLNPAFAGTGVVFSSRWVWAVIVDIIISLFTVFLALRFRDLIPVAVGSTIATAVFWKASLLPWYTIIIVGLIMMALVFMSKVHSIGG